MLRVLVVEDEEMIRKGIVLATDWQSLRCVVVGGLLTEKRGLRRRRRASRLLSLRTSKCRRWTGSR